MQERETKKEKDCLSFEEFCEVIRNNIQHRIENAEVSIEKVVKINDVKLHGLVIREKGGSNITPNIYLDEFYEEYLQWRELCDIEQGILAIYRRSKPRCCFDVKGFRDWNWVKERIVFRLTNLKWNREYLKDTPYFPFLDLAVTFHCLIASEELGNASVVIRNNHLEMWGISREELYATARENTPKLLPPVIQNMAELLMELEGNTGGMKPQDDGFMYILSNQNRNNGAVCLLYEGVLQEFADSLGDDLYILPSSIHETILMPAEGMDWFELESMVNIVNREHVETMEVLSDRVYRFVRATGKIIMQEEEEV